MRARFSSAPRRVLYASAAIACTLGLSSVAATLASDARMRACGLDASTPVVAAFEMTRAMDYRAHIPLSPVLPELEAETRRAHVIVVQGPIRIGRMGPAGVVHEADDTLVCVIVDDVATVYANLDIRDLAR